MSLRRWNERPRSWLTVYTSPGHAFLDVAGIRLDTSTAGEPGGRADHAGDRWCDDTSGYEPRHPRGDRALSRVELREALRELPVRRVQVGTCHCSRERDLGLPARVGPLNRRGDDAAAVVLHQPLLVREPARRQAEVVDCHRRRVRPRPDAPVLRVLVDCALNDEVRGLDHLVVGQYLDAAAPA